MFHNHRYILAMQKARIQRVRYIEIAQNDGNVGFAFEEIAKAKKK